MKNLSKRQRRDLFVMSLSHDFKELIHYRKLGSAFEFMVNYVHGGISGKASVAVMLDLITDSECNRLQKLASKVSAPKWHEALRS